MFSHKDPSARPQVGNYFRNAPLVGLGHDPTLNFQHEEKRWGQALNRRNELNGNKSLRWVHDMRNRRIPGMVRVIKSSAESF